MQTKSIQDIESAALTNIFAEVGERYGYTNVTADFAPFRDLKVSWQRSYRNAEFHIADYLREATEDALRSLAECIFAKIMGEEDQKYSEEFCKYITSEEFVQKHQYTYLKRSKNITRSSSGEYKRLNDSYHRLIKAGYVNKDKSLVLSWMKNEGTGSTGYCSPIMHVIVISKMLDREDIPDHVLDYVLLDQILKMNEGMVNFCRKKQDDVDAIREAYESFPDADDAKQWIDSICMIL